MKRSRMMILVGVCLACVAVWGSAAAQEAKSTLSVADVLNRVEARYDCDTFAADFFQTSILKAMDITDTAEGTVQFKRPKRFRWLYGKPEKQHIISDGKQLWIFKPDENQVTVGEAPALFGDGRGASFFADMKSLRADFVPTLSQPQKEGTYLLRLEPKKKSLDIAVVHMIVDGATFEVTAIETINAYEDKTRIEFNNRRFNQPAPDSLFRFDIPVDADVIELNSENDG